MSELSTRTSRVSGIVGLIVWISALCACGGQPISTSNNNNENTSGGCGDGVVDPGEVCDSTNLDGQACADLGQGFTGGVLACQADCEDYDTAGCVTLVDCGNGALDNGETCDGTALDGTDCVDLGFDEGELACQADCSAFDLSDCRIGGVCGNGLVDVAEQCDGSNLDGNDCTTVGQGFTGGMLGCAPSCTFDTAGCTTAPNCGNGNIDAGEACDGNNLAANDCTTLGLGFTGGTLACNAGCTDFNTAGCVTDLCGNTVLDLGEVCDGADHDGNNCTTIGQGFTGGTLACNSTCDDWVTTGCTTTPPCGNGNLDTGELCDGANHDGNDCTTIGMGFTGGLLGCNGTCNAWVTSACTGGCPATSLGAWNGVQQVLSINTCNGAQSYSTPGGGGGCTGWPAAGSELLYALSLASGESVSVSYVPAVNADGSLYVLTDCADTGATTCVAGSDEIGDGTAEFVLLTNTSAATRTYFIVADNFSGCGPSTLTLDVPPTCGDGVREQPELCDVGDVDGQTCTSIGGGFIGGVLACNGTCDGWDTSGCVAPACGDGAANGTEVCDDTDLRGNSCTTIGQGFTGGSLACASTCDAWDTSACTVGCNETDLGFWFGAPINRSGSTCNGTQSYSPPGATGCTGYGADGFELLYGLTLPGLTSVDIVYGAAVDNSLYVLTDCADTGATTCVAGADSNFAAPFSETLTLTNNSNTPVRYHIVLDSWLAGECGNFTLSINP